MNCPLAAARRRSIAGAVSCSINSVCSIITTASAPRGMTRRWRSRSRCRRHFERRRNPAGDHFGVERKPLRRAVAGADRIGRAHGKAVDIGAIERRRVDRRDHVGCKHAGQAQRRAVRSRRQRRTIGAGLETPARFRRGHDFEKCSCRAARRTASRIAGPRLPLGFQGHGITATCAPAGKPSLSAGTTIQPSLRASAANDR